MVEPPVTQELAELEARPAPRPRPALGYAMVTGAVSLWAVNATVSKVVLQSGMSAYRLSEVRAAGAAALFIAAAAAARPRSLEVARRELPLLVVFGVLGLAFVQSLLGRLDGVIAPVWPLLLFVVALGTFVPFILMIGSLHHIPATRATIIAMLEPLIAAVVAYAWLEESLTPGQIVGGALVLAGVGIAQTARPAT